MISRKNKNFGLLNVKNATKKKRVGHARKFAFSEN